MAAAPFMFGDARLGLESPHSDGFSGIEGRNPANFIQYELLILHPLVGISLSSLVSSDCTPEEFSLGDSGSV
jgi:hypothetical protein